MGGGWAGMGSRTLTDALGGRWRVRAPRRFGGYFRNDADHRDYVSIGTAAGALPAITATTSLSTCCFGVHGSSSATPPDPFAHCLAVAAR